MRRASLNEDGCMDLALDQSSNYIMTKWYGQSLAVFEESAFQRYLNQLDTRFKDNGNGRSVIRYFLSAAVTAMEGTGGGWILPDELREYAVPGGDPLFCEACPDNVQYKDSMPVCLLASEAHMASALEQTQERHG